MTCHVKQRVDGRFRAVPLASIGMVTVYDEVVTPGKCLGECEMSVLSRHAWDKRCSDK